MDAEALVKRILQCFPGETQGSVAERIGVNQKTISGWKAGLSKPTLDTLEEVVNRTGCSWDWLMTGDKPNSDRPGVHLEPSQTALLQVSVDAVCRGVVEAIEILSQVVSDQKLANRAYHDAEWARAKFAQFQNQLHEETPKG